MPYLKGVDDPYDTFSPLHLWPENPIVHSDAWYQSKLGTYGADNPTGVRGDLRTIYVVKRGTSPRVVKAALLGTNGVTFVSGASLRYKLALRDTWVSFTSLSLVPGGTTVTYGVGTTLSGRIYPALKNGAAVTLRFTRGGAPVSVDLSTTRHTQGLGSGFTATYSTYTATVKPKKQTTYSVVSGSARSPQITLKVRPAVSLQANAATVKAGDVVKFGGTTTPLLPGAAVWLQTKTGTAWSNVTSGVFDANGAWAFDWKAVAGVTAARLRVPATAGFVTGVRPGDRADRHRLTAASGARRTQTSFSSTSSRIGSPDPSKGATRAWQGEARVAGSRPPPHRRGRDRRGGGCAGGVLRGPAQPPPSSPRPSSSAGVSGKRWRWISPSTM